MNIWKELMARKQMIKAFKYSGLYITVGSDERKIFPRIHSVKTTDHSTEYVFTLPNGLDPKILKKNFFAFHQVFGKNVELKGDFKTFVITIFTAPVTKVDYDYKQILKVINDKELKMPIVAGRNLNGELHVYDATNHPNLLIFGEPGSGKSTILHSILTTQVQYFSPNQLKLVLADFKQTELCVYEDIEHTDSVSYDEKTFALELKKLKLELTKRGQLLKQHKVRHINKLPDHVKPPYIMLCVDEFVMIKDKNVMAELLQIVSLGRAYGIYGIFSMQRPSHSIISTDVRAVLSVRMGFRTVDLRNAMIGETPGSEKISKDEPGRFLFNMEGLTEMKAPYLTEEDVENILEGYKCAKPKKRSKQPLNASENVIDLQETEKDIFGVLG